MYQPYINHISTIYTYWLIYVYIHIYIYIYTYHWGYHLVVRELVGVDEFGGRRGRAFWDELETKCVFQR